MGARDDAATSTRSIAIHATAMSKKSRAQKQRARASAPPPSSTIAPTVTKTQRRKLQKKRSKSSKQHAAAASAQASSSSSAAASSSSAASISVVFEDAHLIAINKPVGMLCHPSPGFWNSGTVVHALPSRERTAGFSEIGAHMLEARRSHTGEDDSFIPRAIVHRLDRGTTGLLLVAKSELAEDRLTQHFKQRHTSKRYVALLSGVPKPESAPAASLSRVDANGGVLRIDAPIDRDPSRAGKYCVAANGKAASSIVHVHALSSGWSLVTIDLLTGRSHQIRVHCAQCLGAPLANDDAYGGERVHGLPKNRPLLHAWSMEVPHPSDGTTLSVRAPLPDDMRDQIAKRFPSLGAGVIDDPSRWPTVGLR